MTTFEDIQRKGGHSYRNFHPEMIIEIAQNPDLSDEEKRKESQMGLRFIESGRMWDMAEETYELFVELTPPDRTAFTRRNPDLVQWMCAYGATQPDRTMLPGGYKSARAALTPDRSEATNPPPYEKFDAPFDEPVKSLVHRESKYGNYSPHEILDLHPESLYEEERLYTVGKSEALAGNMWSMDHDYPIEIDSPRLARKIMRGIEIGKLYDAADEATSFFTKLDLDERRSFAARNPGMVMWISAYGKSNHLIHGKQLQVPYPTLFEA